MKYYIYRSVAKIGMLWEQLSDKEVEKYSGELKINLGVISAGIKAEPTEKNLHGQLEIVLKHLKTNNQIGDIGRPLAFFRGVIPMTWQELSFYRSESNQRMVLFCGIKDSEKTLVALVGSAAYVTGMSDLKPSTLGYAQPRFWCRIIEELNVPSEKEFKENFYDLNNIIHLEAHRTSEGLPKQILEFVAKTFITKRGFLFGSPLYVAETSEKAHGE